MVNPAKRLALGAAGTVSTLVLLVSYHTSTAGSLSPKADTVAVGDPAVSAPSATSSGSSSSSSGTTSSGSATSATYTGDSVETRWGPVQVRITVVGGKVTAATAVVHPSGNHRDEEINSQALPVYEQEAIAAQSAQIDVLSGATVTWQGYTGSLQSALDQARLS